MGARLRGGASNEISFEAALLAQDEQAAEQSPSLGGQRDSVAHDVSALAGGERTERHLVGEGAGGRGHGWPTLTSSLERPNPLTCPPDYKVNTAEDRRQHQQRQQRQASRRRERIGGRIRVRSARR